MFTRPLDQNIAARVFLWDEFIGDKKGTNHGAARFMAMYQKSRSSKETAYYFLPTCKQTISVSGDDSKIIAPTVRDVRAEWLGLPSNFSGYYSLNPVQRQVGGIITYNQDIVHLTGWSWLKNVWFVLSVPFIDVKQGLCPSQKEVTNPGSPAAGQPYDLIDAFNQPAFVCGRISPCTLSKFRPAELNIGFGSTWIARDGYLLWYQSTMGIPLSGHNDPTYLFSPLIGPNGHFSWANEVAIALPLLDECSTRSCQLMINIASNYLFAHNQWRVLDLKHKPWSRYLLYRNKRTGDVVPGLTLLTQPVRVHPHNFVNFATGLRFGSHNTRFEIGYGIWAHRREVLQFLQPCCATKCPPITDFGIAGVNGGTASRSTIFEQASNDDVFVTLHQNDVDRNSGASQSEYTQSIHAELGYKSDLYFAALGASYEKPHRNAALNVWEVWANIGISF